MPVASADEKTIDPLLPFDERLGRNERYCIYLSLVTRCDETSATSVSLSPSICLSLYPPSFPPVDEGIWLWRSHLSSLDAMGCYRRLPLASLVEGLQQWRSSRERDASIGMRVFPRREGARVMSLPPRPPSFCLGQLAVGERTRLVSEFSLDAMRCWQRLSPSPVLPSLPSMRNSGCWGAQWFGMRDSASSRLTSSLLLLPSSLSMRAPYCGGAPRCEAAAGVRLVAVCHLQQLQLLIGVALGRDERKLCPRCDATSSLLPSLMRAVEESSLVRMRGTLDNEL
ncbi:hypothetical protein PRIPAC_85309 [Pristionchus pacificus]|uniref:Uncharacterized protein n=1 Tax=Pristionchus pacificus TaxID=54126 RepID=A0A2A6CCJ3_PRIPA|nr:hypothetical protein PRIPAC_85309 [Pristionchus pacificus]|eukprot:PDM75827.1 hypothetical protein PRIPAC_40206 [Pristionchus pacificus]